MVIMSVTWLNMIWPWNCNQKELESAHSLVEAQGELIAALKDERAALYREIEAQNKRIEILKGTCDLYERGISWPI
jgi:hypothetical protein